MIFSLLSTHTTQLNVFAHLCYYYACLFYGSIMSLFWPYLYHIVVVLFLCHGFMSLLCRHNVHIFIDICVLQNTSLLCRNFSKKSLILCCYSTEIWATIFISISAFLVSLNSIPSYVALSPYFIKISFCTISVHFLYTVLSMKLVHLNVL